MQKKKKVDTCVLHRKCFTNLVYPSIWKSTAKILCSQFGLKIFLCVIWHILQLSKNFNQFHKNLFWREWSNNYTSKSNSPFDREKLTWRIDFEAFCKKRGEEAVSDAINFPSVVKIGFLQVADMNWVSTWIIQTVFSFLALSSQTRCICPNGQMYLSKLSNLFA